ncbi:hypothetical protein ONE63_001627 [Megalurothrips usitatus]|uniref:Uncharacterized protein n=1 Tax=Megalurothrips usitatus TaxID=439358 RepID=A0AAV7X901_9NEOP|nr:hypothetical protein ONE63_001627 [Megalurothrips usitatus]
MDHKCPRCRQAITAVSSQLFDLALLKPNSPESVEQEDQGESEITEMKQREQEILAELEQVPNSMKAMKKDVNKLKKEASAMLKVISTLECRKHLQSIDSGKTKSERHDDFMEAGMLFSGLGPYTLFEDLKNELLEIVDKHCENMDPTYQWSVMIPEAIIYGAQIILKKSKADATAYFDHTSKLVAVQE